MFFCHKCQPYSMTSLIQTAGHKMAAPMVMFLVTFKRWFLTHRTKKSSKQLLCVYFLFYSYGASLFWFPFKHRLRRRQVGHKQKRRRSKHITGQNGKLFIVTKHNMQIFWVSPFFKLQNNTLTTVKQWKMTCRICIFFWLGCFCCFSVQCLEEC